MGKITDEMNQAKPDATGRIQEDIRNTEADITATLHEIEGRFRPAHIKAEVKEKVRQYSVTTLVKVTDAIRSKPVPAALLGAGVAILIIRKMTKRRKGSKVSAADLAAAGAMPKEVKRHPVETIKHYITLGKMVIAVGSALSTYLLREKPARRAYAPRPPRDLHGMPGARVFPAGMHDTIAEDTGSLVK